MLHNVVNFLFDYIYIHMYIYSCREKRTTVRQICSVDNTKWENRDVIDGCVKGKTKEITLPSKTHPSKYHNTLDYSFKRDLLDLDSSSSFFSIGAHVTLSIALSNLTKPTIDAFSSSSFSPFRLDNRLDIFVITFTIVIQDAHLSFSNMQNAYRARLQFLDPIQSSNQMFTGISLIFIIYIYILCITRFLHRWSINFIRASTIDRRSRVVFLSFFQICQISEGMYQASQASIIRRTRRFLRRDSRARDGHEVNGIIYLFINHVQSPISFPFQYKYLSLILKYN